MAEKVIKIVNKQIIETIRDPNKQYKYTSHPVTKENCYIELTAAELAQRQKDIAEINLIRSMPVPPTLEERIAALEVAITDLKNKKP